MERPEALPTAEVIRLLRIKVARNPGDLDAGLMLGSVLYKSGDPEGSAAALETVLRNFPDHQQALLLLARAEARAGNHSAALKTLARAHRLDPSNTQAWQVAVALAIEIRDWRELLRVAEGWTRHHANSPEAWKALSRAHFEESQFREALNAYAQVLDLEPDNVANLIGAARIAIAAQLYDQARSHLDTARKVAPESAELLYTFGRLHHMTGELASAETFYHSAIKARPGFATAYVELGTLRDGKLDDEEIQAISNLFDDNTVHPEYRVMLGFTLGNAMDRRQHYDRAFEAWSKANEINKTISAQEGFVYQPELVENEQQLITEIFADTVEPEPALLVGSQPQPVFVVGMPRSGTTLVESILASHSEVYGAGELPTLYDIHQELIDVARNQGIRAARDRVQSEANAWRERYLSALPLTGAESRVVDKQPLNYRSIGLIRLLFPESPIVYTHRSPLDVGLSIYRHKFSKDWPCAHSLKDIGHYYGVHARIVDFWNARFPDSIHWLDHSRLVENPEIEINRLLKFAGLSPQSACFKPHQTKRSIATFSSAQVRQPMSTEFTGRALRYKVQLAPLQEALTDSGVDLAGCVAMEDELPTGR